MCDPTSRPTLYAQRAQVSAVPVRGQPTSKAPQERVGSVRELNLGPVVNEDGTPTDVTLDMLCGTQCYQHTSHTECTKAHPYMHSEACAKAVGVPRHQPDCICLLCRVFGGPNIGAEEPTLYGNPAWTPPEPEAEDEEDVLEPPCGLCGYQPTLHGTSTADNGHENMCCGTKVPDAECPWFEEWEGPCPGHLMAWEQRIAPQPLVMLVVEDPWAEPLTPPWVEHEPCVCISHPHTGRCAVHLFMVKAIHKVWDTDPGDKILAIWALSDGYGDPGFMPVQGLDWSGIRDSSVAAVEAMYRLAVVL